MRRLEYVGWTLLGIAALLAAILAGWVAACEAYDSTRGWALMHVYVDGRDG